ncbi:MAG: hypothetical protein IKD08_00610 [Alphaproteobacteria bacterium]|nr:hypothetical protein [Alphaproteobacteria bacterium]
MPEIIVNIVIICLLIPTIIFAYVLNKKLDVLRNSRNDLGRLIEAFNDATIRAESGIPKLRQAADSAGGQLKEQVEKAQILRDDLAFLIDRAESSATKLEHSVRQVRTESRNNAPTETKAKITEIEEMLTSGRNDDIMIDDDQTDAEKELLKALKALK